MSVSKETRETITATVEEAFEKIDRTSWLVRQKKINDETFRNTEKILFSYQTLKEYIADEEEYLAVVFHKSSSSFVRYSKYGHGEADEDALMDSRMASYERSRHDVERIEKALDKIKDWKGYDVIELRYFQRKKHLEGKKIVEELYTFEEIAEILSMRDDYSSTISERTVRRYKNKLVREVAVLLFGSDAV